jgi:hypothetical protein
MTPRLQERAIETFERIASALEAIASSAAVDDGPALFSLRKAAAALGIDRGSTLADLIAAKKIRTVTVKGAMRIPISEVRRFRESYDSGRKHRARPKNAGNPKKEILAIEL